MTPSPLLRRATHALAVSVLVLGVAACGSPDGADEIDGTDQTTSEGAADPGDASDAGLGDPGDDRLDAVRTGVELRGLEQRVTWRYPVGYEIDLASPQQGTLTDGGTTFELSVGAIPGAEQSAEGRRLVDDAPAEVQTATEDVEIGGRTFTTATLDSPGTSLRAFFYTPSDEDATYAVMFRSGVPLDQTPPERLEEVYQMVVSLELEPKQGTG